MLAGLKETSENVSESGARQAASGNISGGGETRRSISLPHKGAILRHDPAVFD